MASMTLGLFLTLNHFQTVEPIRSEVIMPIRNATFDKNGTAKVRKQGGSVGSAGSEPFMFDGSQDGNRQVDPQIAVGGGYVLHGTNSGIVIYDKKGIYLRGVPQSEFNNGIDPKMFFDMHNRVFGFDLWNPWDDEKKKPVNVSISESDNPLKAWNTYPVPAPNGVDGGGIGFSRKWIGYSFPGGDERTFVMKASEAKAGRPATVYHFSGTLGHPVFTQDKSDDLYFVTLTERDIILTNVGTGPGDKPVVKSVTRREHKLRYFGWPPQSPMKGVTQRTASGDRNPKNLVIQGNHLWFSHTVNVDGRAGVQWNQFKLDGTLVQSGLIAHLINSYIETTLAVNNRGDVLIGFQETGPEMFISARAALHKGSDPAGTTSKFFRLREGLAATEGGAWGDYSGSVIDGDNLRDLWTIQSFANLKGRGGTVIARFSL
jgi:hypothetical protein